MIKFFVSTEDREVIYKIAKRASKVAHQEGIQYSLLTAQMDITAVHANGNPLKLEELLKADDANFGHDVFGIRRYINRKTGSWKTVLIQDIHSRLPRPAVIVQWQDAAMPRL